MTNRKKQKITKREKLIWHICRECHIGGVRTYESVISVICSRCMQENAAPPELPGYVPTGRPRGWHFRKFFEHEGKVYSRGKEVQDLDLIEALRKEHGSSSNKKKEK